MQTPLFWVDLSAYGAELQAIEADGRLCSLMVDLGSEPSDTLAQHLRRVGFVSHDAANPQRVTHAKPTDETISHIELALAESQNTAFDVGRHLLVANLLDPDAPPRPPVRNTVQKERDAVHATAPAPDPTPPEEKDKLIVDVGRVLGFPIKELRGNGDKLRAAAAQMNRDQQEKYLRKSTLWPSPDYSELAAEGVEPAAASLIKSVRDSFLTAPGVISSRRKYREPPHPEVFAHAIVTARDVISPVKTLDEAARAVYRLTEMFSVTRKESTSHSRFGPRCWTRHLSPLTEDSAGEPLSESDRALRGVVNPRHDFWLVAIDPDNQSRIDDVIERFSWLGTRGTAANTTWGFLPRNHKLRTGASGKLSEEEKARRAARERAKPPTRIPRSSHADAVREGLEQWRSGDVSAEDLIEQFDLSGVEFGNWESQRDRQELLNQAYDAFSDLSQALRIPTHAIGLGGRLGMAFGSRGQGGKNPAAAHFEPENFAINLTKRGGAGSLAHEWGHAFDRAGSLGGRIGRHARMASDDLVGHRNWSEALASRSAFGDATAENFDSLMSMILYDPNESVKQSTRMLEQRQWHQIAIQAQDYRRIYVLERKEQPVLTSVEELVTAFSDASEQRLMDDCMLDESMARGFVSRIVNDTPFGDEHVLAQIQEELGVDGHDVVSELGRLHTAVKETVSAGLKIAVVRKEQSAFKWPGLDETTVNETTEVVGNVIYYDAQHRRAPSAMFRQAREMDESRSARYWSRSDEMFARAFECYVKTRIAEQGGRNDFLVSYSKPENMNGEVYKSVYPTGTHLAGVKTAADALFSGLSIDERESASPMRSGKTGVVLYSFDGDRIMAGAPPEVVSHLALAEVRRIAGDAVGVLFEDKVVDEGSEYVIGGMYEREKKLISVALSGNDPVSTARHEAFHAASDCLLTEDEATIVRSAFWRGGRFHRQLTDALESEGRFAAIVSLKESPEEAAAYGFQLWQDGKLEIEARNPVARIFQRIRDFSERIDHALKGMGFKSARDVLKSLDDGTIAQRSAHGTDHQTDDAEADKFATQPAESVSLS